ncbi:GntR family transcriptional regulator [Virgibacillus sp. NKC19-3]|nr:GntR family transcriptional regulator [Virgibacillus sp. NKC19-3]
MEDIIKKIDAEEYREHERLPSERELCDRFDVSRITVRQTLQELEREGYIYKLHGKGTFVGLKTFNQNLVKMYSFTEEMKTLGKQPATHVLSFQIIAVDERLASKIDLEPLDDVYQVIRLRLADDEALMYETSYLPKRIFPNLTKADFDQRPMYDIFLEDYQIGITKAIERFSPTSVRQKEADYLQAPIDQPAMLVKRFAYHNDKLVEYTVSVARGDKFDYTVELT